MIIGLVHVIIVPVIVMFILNFVHCESQCMHKIKYEHNSNSNNNNMN